MKSLNKFPTVTRDLAFIFDKSVSYADIEAAGKKVGKPLLAEMTMFDLYENEAHVGKDKKSVALRFVFEDTSKTLTDKDIDQKMEELINIYTKDLKANLRN
jgi:phenylalanyl-tRNA synthetase beta chain